MTEAEASQDTKSTEVMPGEIQKVQIQSGSRNRVENSDLREIFLA